MDETHCPECGVEINTTNFRLVREGCGHTKCRQCLLTAENGCAQCLEPPTQEVLTEYEIEEEEEEEVQLGVEDEEEHHSTKTIFLVDSRPANEGGEAAQRVQVVGRETHVIYDDLGQGFSVQASDELYDDEEGDAAAAEGLQAEEEPNEDGEFVVFRKTRSAPRKNYSEDHLPAHISQGVDANNKVTYKCTACKKTIARGVINYHIYCDPEIPKPYTCNVCSRSFRTAHHFAYHRSTHVSKDAIPCKHCPKSFRNKTTLNTHVRQTHRGLQKPHKCAECGKGYFSAAKYQQHLLVHTNELPFSCTQCDKRFRLKENMLKHCKITHSHEKQFHCSLCDTYFKRSGAYKLHMERLHPKGAQLPMKCQCKVCGEEFTHGTLLRRHERTHQGLVLEYDCLICCTKLSRKDNMTRHMRTMHLDGDTTVTPREGEHYRLVERVSNVVSEEGGKARTAATATSSARGGGKQISDVLFEDEIIEEEEEEVVVLGEEGDVREGEAETFVEHIEEDVEEVPRKSSVIIYVGAPKTAASVKSPQSRQMVSKRKQHQRTRHELEEFANMPSEKMEIYRKILMPNRDAMAENVEVVEEEREEVEVEVEFLRKPPASPRKRIRAEFDASFD